MVEVEKKKHICSSYMCRKNTTQQKAETQDKLKYENRCSNGASTFFLSKLVSCFSCHL